MKLYQIMYFPFDEEEVQPRVLHGDKVDEGEEAPTSTVVECYFDASGKEPVRSEMDPGYQIVDACLQRVSFAKSEAMRRNVRRSPHYPTVHIASKPELSVVPADRRQAAGEISGNGVGPPKIVIEKTFNPPDTTTLQQWYVFECAVLHLNI